jgi:hypothetical protein
MQASAPDIMLVKISTGSAIIKVTYRSPTSIRDISTIGIVAVCLLSLASRTARATTRASAIIKVGPSSRVAGPAETRLTVYTY